MLTHSVHVISQMDSIKCLFENLVVNGRLSRWIIMLSEFNLKFIPKKSVKGRVIFDFLAKQPIEEHTEKIYDFPDEGIMTIEDAKRWGMYFDGVTNQKGYGVRVILVSPKGAHTPILVKLEFEITNNIIEYESCIIGLKAAIQLGVIYINVYGDFT